MLGNKRKNQLSQIQRDPTGQYIYTGDYYTYSGKTPRRKALSFLWILFGLSTVFAVLAGLIPAPGSTGSFYVPLPLVISIVVSISQLWYLGLLSLAGDPVREYIYETACQRLPVRSLFTSVFAGITFLGECIYTIIHGAGDPPELIAGFLALMLLTGICSLIGRKLLLTLTWEKSA